MTIGHPIDYPIASVELVYLVDLMIVRDLLFTHCFDLASIDWMY